VRIVLAIACLAVAVAAVLTYADHRTCEDARGDLFAASLGQRPAQGVDAAVADIREHCRGTAGTLAAAGALRALGRRDQALRLAREAAAEEPDNPAAWRAVAATASGSEARSAERRLAALDPRSL
jgi:hypothetical protein